MRNVIVAGYVTFYEINTFFINLLFFIVDKMYLRPEEMVSSAGIGPRAVVGSHLI